MTSLIGWLVTAWTMLTATPVRDERGGGGGPSTETLVLMGAGLAAAALVAGLITAYIKSHAP